MMQFVMDHFVLAVVLSYGALALVVCVLLINWMEDERGRSANASPGLCGNLGRGLRRLGGALGRFRRP